MNGHNRRLHFRGRAAGRERGTAFDRDRFPVETPAAAFMVPATATPGETFPPKCASLAAAPPRAILGSSPGGHLPCFFSFATAVGERVVEWI